MTARPDSTTKPSARKMPDENLIPANFCNSIATMSVPPVVACWRTTMPCPTPMTTAPMTHVSSKSFDRSSRPPSNSDGSRLSTAAASG